MPLGKGRIARREGPREGRNGVVRELAEMRGGAADVHDVELTIVDPGATCAAV